MSLGRTRLVIASEAEHSRDEGPRQLLWIAAAPKPVERRASSDALGLLAMTISRRAHFALLVRSHPPALATKPPLSMTTACPVMDEAASEDRSRAVGVERRARL